MLSNSRANKTRRERAVDHGGIFLERWSKRCSMARPAPPRERFAPLTDGMHDGDKIRDLQAGFRYHQQC